jgi:hypothetical protein
VDGWQITVLPISKPPKMAFTVMVAISALILTGVGRCSWQPAAVGSERLVGPLNHTSEGVTTDGGEKLWFNGVSNIWVSNKALNVSQHRGDAIPPSFRAVGYKHMGDSAYYSGHGLNTSRPVILGGLPSFFPSNWGSRFGSAEEV